MKKRGVTYLKDEKIAKYNRVCFVDGFLIGILLCSIIALLAYYLLLT